MSGDLGEDLITIVDDPEEALPGHEPWRLLVVDDDEEVHIATRLALGDMQYAGRSLRIESCHSGLEAFEYLKGAQDVACILLDVVMENEHAGLDLVREIREVLNNHQIRIILRTGQPGYAPELEVIRSYDINDYKAKTELTVTRLMACVLTALRSYDQMMTIEEHRRGLEMVIHSSANLFSKRNLMDFGAGVLTQLAAQLGVSREGLICTGVENGEPIIVAAAGAFAPYTRHPLAELGQPRIEAAIAKAFKAGANVFTDDYTVFYLNSEACRAGAIFIQGSSAEIDRQRRLIELFAQNIALGFETAQLMERLSDTAFTDAVTGLKSRAGFIQMVEHTLPHPNHPGQNLMVLVLDIDHFNMISERLGFHAGDDLLKGIADKFRAAFPEAVAIGRLAGDAFGLALPEEMIATIAERTEKAFETPIVFSGIETTISLTGGFSLSSWHTDPHGELLVRQASLAMKEAKKQARGRIIAYDIALEKQSDVQMALISDLRRGLRDGELILHYQPKVDLATGKGIGVEALVRWQSGRRGLVFPGSFIEAAEVSGLIIPLGRTVFENALKQRQAWLQQKLDVSVAVNVSAVQIHQHDFLEAVDGMLGSARADAAGIEIEVTESCFLGSDDRIFHYLEALRKRGFSLALDDFGTGYSSLSSVHRMPLSTIKIDRSFVTDVTESHRSQVLVAAIVNVAQSMGAKVVAEGIETEAQAKMLRELGVPYGQGYFFGKPMSAADLTEWWHRTGSAG